MSYEYQGVTVTLYRAEIDGKIVVAVDTDPEAITEGPEGPEIRVYVNDGMVYEGKACEAES